LVLEIHRQALVVWAHARLATAQWQLAPAHALHVVPSRWASAFVLAPAVFVLAAAILHVLK